MKNILNFFAKIFHIHLIGNAETIFFYLNSLIALSLIKWFENIVDRTIEEHIIALDY